MATNPYVNKVVYGNQTVIDLSGDTADASDVLQGQTFHDRSGALVTGTALGGLSYEDNAILGARNFLELSDENIRISTVTCTYLDTGVELQSSGGTYQFTSFWMKNLPQGRTIKISADVTITSGKGCIYVRDVDTSTIVIQEDISASGHYDFTFSTGSYDSLALNLYSSRETSVAGDVSYENLVVKLSTDTATSYSPYAQTNIELTESKMSYKDNGILGAKNRFDYTVGTATSNTTLNYLNNGRQITITTSSDGTYKAGRWLLDVETNTDYIITCSTLITSGKTAISVSTEGGTEIAKTSAYSTSGDMELEFNSGNNSKVRIFLYCTWNTSESGDVSYSDVLFRLASDADNIYQPYAKTNRELTDSLDGWTAEVTVSSNTATFSNLDDSYAYKLFCDEPNVVTTNTAKTGSGTSMQLIYTLSGATSSAKCKLRIIK